MKKKENKKRKANADLIIRKICKHCSYNPPQAMFQISHRQKACFMLWRRNVVVKKPTSAAVLYVRLLCGAYKINPLEANTAFAYSSLRRRAVT